MHYFRNQNEALAFVLKHNLYQPVDDSFVEKESEDKVEKLAVNDDAEEAEGGAEEDEGKKKEEALEVNLTKRIVTWPVVWDYLKRNSEWKSRHGTVNNGLHSGWFYALPECPDKLKVHSQHSAR